MKTKHGRVYRVTNKDKKFGANSRYLYIKAKNTVGDSINLLLTDAQLVTAQERAARNPEDCLKNIPLKEWLRR
tara:strand:+ start:64 stop:282 length:219 start_codon:yes stop_codon:yes gene_type:complete